MRTKLTVGLVGGLLIVIQAGSAQGISTVGADDTTFGNAVTDYAPMVTVANTNVSDKSFRRSADGSWVELGAQQGLEAISYQATLPLMPTDNEFAGISSSSADDFTTRSSGIYPMAEKAGMRGRTDSMPKPQISAPEPSTIGLLLLGGATLAGGALRRRKQAA